MEFSWRFWLCDSRLLAAASNHAPTRAASHRVSEVSAAQYRGSLSNCRILMAIAGREPCISFALDGNCDMAYGIKEMGRSSEKSGSNRTREGMRCNETFRCGRKGAPVPMKPANSRAQLTNGIRQLRPRNIYPLRMLSISRGLPMFRSLLFREKFGVPISDILETRLDHRNRPELVLPFCPRCRTPMVLRRIEPGRHGSYRGKFIYDTCSRVVIDDVRLLPLELIQG